MNVVSEVVTQTLDDGTQRHVVTKMEPIKFRFNLSCAGVTYKPPTSVPVPHVSQVVKPIHYVDGVGFGACEADDDTLDYARGLDRL